MAIFGIFIIAWLIISLIREKKGQQTWIDNLFDGLILTLIGGFFIIIMVLAIVEGNQKSSSTEMQIPSSDSVLIVNGIPMNEAYLYCFGIALFPALFVSGVVKLVRTIKRRREGYTNYYKKKRKT